MKEDYKLWPLYVVAMLCLSGWGSGRESETKLTWPHIPTFVLTPFSISSGGMRLKIKLQSSQTLLLEV